MPCLAKNGTKMTAGNAMSSGCKFVVDELKSPYSQSMVHISRTGEGGKRRKTRKGRKSRKATRRSRRR